MTQISKTTWSKLLAVGWLVGYISMFVTLYVMSLSRPTYLVMIETMRQPFSNNLSRILLLLVIWYGLLAVGWRRFGAQLWRQAWWVILIISGLALVTFPMTSIDTAAYLVGARNMIQYGHSPLLLPLAGTPNPWSVNVNFAFWYYWPLPYGPAFMMLMYGIAHLSPTDIWLALVIYKLFTAAIWGWLLWQFARFLKRQGSDPSRVLLLAMNPAFLIHGLMDGHSDVLSVALMVAGLSALMLRKEARGYSWWSLAIVVKVQSVILWPLGWYRDGRWQPRAFVQSVCIGGAFLWIFMSLCDLTLSKWAANLGYFNKGCLYFCSPAVRFFQSLGVSPVLAGIVLYLLAAWWFITKKADPIRAAFWLMFVVVFVATTWFAPWYLLYLIPFALLVDKQHYDVGSFILTVAAFLPFWIITAR